MFEAVTPFALRACCLDAPPGVGFVEMAGEPGTLSTPSAPLVVEHYARPAYENDRALAWHEAGHSLVAIIAGARVLRVTLRDPNPFAACQNVPRAAHAVFALAGPYAENLARGWVRPVPEAVAVDHIDRVSIPAGGFCDLYRASRACVVKAGLGEREHAFVLFRAAERATVDLLEHENARRFLRVAAHELLRNGELAGERVHAIADEILDPSTLETLRKIIERN